MSAEPRAVAPETIRLLLVEDDHQDHSLICDLLDAVPDVSFAIDWVKDLATGRDRLKCETFDACLIGQKIADGGGLELLEYRTIKALPLPMIMMAEQGTKALDRQAMALGASGFLDKSRLDPTLLERTIRYAMQHARATECLKRTTFRDMRTGLITPMLLHDRLARALMLAKRRQTLVALVVIDAIDGTGEGLDNERCEQQLAYQAKVLIRHLRESDSIARVTDRHLAFVLEDLRNADDAGLVTQKVLLGLAKTGLSNGRQKNTKPFAGIALYPKDCDSADRMLQRANDAMCQAKAKGVPGFCFANEGLEQKRQKRILLSQDLQHALEQKALRLRYRPLINTTNKKIGLSAEVQLQGATDSILSTDQFLPIADDPSLIEKLTDWIVRETVKQLQRWQNQGFDAVELAFPFISKRPSHLPFLERSIRQHLLPAAIKPNLIEIDLEHDLFLNHLTDDARGLTALKTLGVRLAMMDFGRDDNSLDGLANDHLDSLKLSQDLYQDLPGYKSRERLLKAIVNLGHDLDLRIVADGAHDERQFSLLKDIGCDAIKLSTTCSPAAAEKFLAWHGNHTPSQPPKKPKISIKTRLPLTNRQKLPRSLQATSNKPQPSLDPR